MTPAELTNQAQLAFEQALPDDATPYEIGQAFVKVGEHLAACLAEEADDFRPNTPSEQQRAALAQAYRYITQPKRFGGGEATYSTADYNRLTTTIRVALGMEKVPS